MDEEHTPDDGETRTLADVDGSGGRPPQEDGLPPAIGPAAGQEPGGGSGPAGRPRPKWLAPAIILVAVAVLAVAGLAVWKASSNRSHDQALAQCSRQVRAVKDSEQQAEAASSTYLQAFAVKEDQVKDTKTVKDLAKAVGKAKHTQVQAFTCQASMSAGDLQAMAGKAKRSDDVYRSLDKAAKAVLASRDAKSLEDAKAALNAKKDEASTLLSDSDGKVADNAVRDSLQQAISQAGSIKGDKAETYQDAADALQSAMDQVNTSIQQKNQADQQQAQAAQAPATRQPARRPAPAQQRPAPSTSRGKQGYTPSRQPSYNHGSSSAPAPAAPAAPAAPQGGSGGFDWNQWVQNHKPYGEACNSAGVCGIG
ncbi:hypothetical protein GYM67_02610 [Bifidobacterium asteroides]|uniref:hypothetical protein n=1 Tax=Bifidobacterium asteroides TaxID=1684 RepID=UPI001C69E48B|nr:hypothetical protein [Bifidobacterium asteroides]QYN60091.1 hypothetical protein GYM67_02610 [Bifidobacterium asteroides]